MVINTFDYKGDDNFTSGEAENGSVYVQLKSTDSLKIGKRDPTRISYSIKRRHLVYWLREPMPVILIVYSVPDNTAYWLHVQPYCKSVSFRMPPKSQEETTVHMPTGNVLDESAIDTFRQYKADVFKKIEGLNLYG